MHVCLIGSSDDDPWCCNAIEVHFLYRCSDPVPMRYAYGGSHVHFLSKRFREGRPTDLSQAATPTLGDPLCLVSIPLSFHPHVSAIATRESCTDRVYSSTATQQTAVCTLDC